MKKNSIFIIISVILFSCNKDYNTVGLNLIDNNPFRTSLEEVPVFVKMRKIPPYVSNSLTTFQLGEFQDNVYGNSKVSFLGQLNFEDPSLAFGNISQAKEDNPDTDNISQIPEEETVKNVFLDIPFFTNVDDDDNDGVINLYDVDSTDPYSDSDGDGVSDNIDTCSNVAGPAANNGCPWPDTDGDGVLDKDDKCPGTAGVSSNNGCPEPTKEIMERLNAVGAMIPFQLNRAELGKEVKGLLGEVLGIMNNYPKTPFMIEGHTDSSGPKAFNQKLSEMRAMSVKEYLVDNGITSSRLMTVGYGEDKPMVSNNTRKGRIKNRRVEFKVIPPPAK